MSFRPSDVIGNAIPPPPEPPALVITPEQLPAVIRAFQEAGLPIEIEMVVGDETRADVTIGLTEQDEAWLRDYLADAQD